MTGLACICFGFVLGTAFTAVCLLADKKKAPAGAASTNRGADQKSTLKKYHETGGVSNA